MEKLPRIVFYVLKCSARCLLQLSSALLGCDQVTDLATEEYVIHCSPALLLLC